MDWENRERMEQAMVYNQFSPIIPPSFFQQSNSNLMVLLFILALYPQSRPTPMPQHMVNTPRFHEKNVDVNFEENKTPPTEDQDKKEDNSDLMNQTLLRIQKLKAELNELKKQKFRQGKSKISPVKGSYLNTTFSQQEKKHSSKFKRNFTEIHKLTHSEKTTIDDIVNKYSSHKATDELKIFTHLFKNYNHTNTKDIDIKEVNNSIENAIQHKEMKNLMLNEKENNNLKKAAPIVKPLRNREFHGNNLRKRYYRSKNGSI